MTWVRVRGGPRHAGPSEWRTPFVLEPCAPTPEERAALRAEHPGRLVERGERAWIVATRGELHAWLRSEPPRAAAWLARSARTLTAPLRWRLRDRELVLGGRTRIMGIVNVTPDSFSDGGRFLDPDRALAHARALVEAGADLLDVGAESTRPHAAAVSPETEWARLAPVVGPMARLGVPLTVDTRRAAVAERALAEGAHGINDVDALSDPDLRRLVARSDAGVVLMASQRGARPEDPVEFTGEHLNRDLERALAAGIEPERVILDPGIGFADDGGASSWTLMAALSAFGALGAPVLVGHSRKRFLASFGAEAVQRDPATATLAALAAAAGVAVVRVHDVAGVRASLEAADRLVRWPLAYVGLGGNVGDVRSTFRQAVAALGPAVRRVSGLYRSAPWGPVPQSPFLNAVVEMDVRDDSPRALLATLMDIEARFGRTRAVRWGPRTLDMDLLLYMDRFVDEPDLAVPHPRILERPFVLEPLRELMGMCALPDGTLPTADPAGVELLAAGEGWAR